MQLIYCDCNRTWRELRSHNPIPSVPRLFERFLRHPPTFRFQMPTPASVAAPHATESSSPALLPAILIQRPLATSSASGTIPTSPIFPQLSLTRVLFPAPKLGVTRAPTSEGPPSTPAVFSSVFTRGPVKGVAGGGGWGGRQKVLHGRKATGAVASAEGSKDSAAARVFAVPSTPPIAFHPSDYTPPLDMHLAVLYRRVCMKVAGW